MSGKKYVYMFADGNAGMRDLLGGKGANLAEMTRLGFPVPPGITITTEACKDYSRSGKFPEGLLEELRAAREQLEVLVGKRLGDSDNPLLVSVRSGAPVSMPGMMDTILNLGLNEETVECLIKRTGDERFALDCYRRFIQMFGDVVMGIEHSEFEKLLTRVKEGQGVEHDFQLHADSLRQLIKGYRGVVKEKTGREFPDEPAQQLIDAVEAVFKSWDNPRAITYRKLNKISDDLGTAVNIQLMVFGNMGATSGTGVAFTRSPSTGEREIYGEFLTNAQGEDVVAGIRTPRPIADLKEEMPAVFEEFLSTCSKLEQHYRDLQDIEFTIEEGKLYLLQTRNGKRTAAAAVKAAVDMVREGLINREEALLRVEAASLDSLLHPRIDDHAKLQVLAQGLAASPGAACGQAVFDPDDAERLGLSGEKVILVRSETTPDDIHGMIQAQGVLTFRGGMTSHAAVVARGMGKPAVTGCSGIGVDLNRKQFVAGGRVVKEGDIISIDGSTGRVFAGEVPLVLPEISGELNTLLEWADGVRRLAVRANADTPEDALRAREYGAQGIGLTRTEHMFMSQDRLPVVQAMILAETIEERQAALNELLPMQQDDFYGILKAMAGFPVTIRLLDPPLHEFLPSRDDLLVEVTRLKTQGEDMAELAAKEQLLEAVESLMEFNPMLGHRGCRLGISFPEIYAMQARAIFEAVAQLTAEGVKVIPEVEIPLVMDLQELHILREVVEAQAKAVQQDRKISFDYCVGTMLELPRACLTADKLASEAEFFSFGTNDLTQTTFGFSRDDSEGKFLPIYLERKILKDSPFVVLDRSGVGKLMEIAVQLGRQTRSDLSIGICGEHGGDPESITFCHEIKLDFVSCSPFRVPVARLAAAQAAVSNKNQSKIN